MHQRLDRRRLSVCAGLLIVTAGCGLGSGGDADSSADGQATVTTTVTATPSVSESPESTSATPEPEASTSADPSGVDGDDQTPSTDVPLPPTDTPLTLDDFFAPNEQWIESRYDVADRDDVLGIGAVVTGCGDEFALPLELRLANKYSSLSFDASQANNSDGSDQVLVVEVVANNEQADIRRVPFNEVRSFTLPVETVNALIVRMYLDSDYDDCGDRSAIGVISRVLLT